MKHYAALLVLTLALGAPAAAQNAGQIQQVQSGQSCTECNLFQANLSYRDLPGVDLSGARLRQADLSLATMNGARFDRADMSIANLFGARFTGASFVSTNFERATLVGAHFGGANLSRANLAGANLSGAELDRARGLTQRQLDAACGDQFTRLPPGLRVSPCAATQ